MCAHESSYSNFSKDKHCKTKEWTAYCCHLSAGFIYTCSSAYGANEYQISGYEKMPSYFPRELQTAKDNNPPLVRACAEKMHSGYPRNELQGHVAHLEFPFRVALAVVHSLQTPATLELLVLLITHSLVVCTRDFYVFTYFYVYYCARGRM